MMYCIVCGGRTDGCLCPRCGFDLSLCRESYPTLSADCPERRALWTLRDAIYRRQKPAAGPRPRPAAGAQPQRTGMRPKEAALPAEGFRIRPNGDGTCAITGLTQDCQGLLVIPDRINGLRVTEIGAKAMMNRTALFSVVIPQSVASVGAFAFYGCKSLQKLRLPDGVELGGKAFGNCQALANVFFETNPKTGTRMKPYFADDAFSGHRPDMYFIASPFSIAAAYAARRGIRLRCPKSEA